jgi:hypothetical protein
MYLGRPWQNATGSTERYNKTVFLNSTYGANIIQPAGWSTWDAGTITSQITYGEYRNRNTDSSLANVSARVAWSKQFTPEDAAVYNNTNLFSGWNPCDVFTQPCNASRDIAVSNFQLKKVAATTQLTWNISWPMTGITYELFRSENNSGFSSLNSQISVNDSSVNFSFTDGVPAPGTSFKYYLVASKPGLASHITDTIIISSVPTITVSGTPGAFIQGIGTPSNVQVYTVAGTNLTNNIVLTPPNGFEISSNNGTTWNNNGNPIALTPNAGNVATTNISVRLNANAAGPYAGNIIHTSDGADAVSLALTGTVSNEPLAVSEALIVWPFNVNNDDSAALRNPALNGSVPFFNILQLSDGVAVPAIPSYSAKFGRAFAPNANGSWGAAAGGNGSALSRIIYDQYTIVANSTHIVRVDSLVLSAAFYNTSSGTRFAILYSKSGFVSDSAEVTGGVGPGGALAASANGQWATPVILGNQTNGPTNTYSFSLNGATGVQLQTGETLTIRLYYACGSTSTGRYAMVKNVIAKGIAEALLPINLISFNAVSKQSDVVTSWKVAHEIAISHYEIQRSENGNEFSTIGRVNAKNDSRPFDYVFTDAKPLAGTNFYRLKIVEKDGKIDYSRAVRVNMHAPMQIQLYPNPAHETVLIVYPAILQNGTYSILNTNGKTIQSGIVSAGSRQQSIKVVGLPAGMYLLQVEGDGRIEMFRFLKE